MLFSTTKTIEDGPVWFECEKSEILASVPFMSDYQNLEGSGILVCRSLKKNTHSEKYRSLAGIFGALLWSEAEKRLGFELREDNPDFAVETLIITCALSILECSGVEAGDVAIVSGKGRLVSALMTVANLQGVRCLKIKTKLSHNKFANYDDLVDLNTEGWRRKLADTDNQVRGSIFFFLFSNNRQELSDILSNLSMMEKLILCSVPIPMKMQVNVYRDIHRRSVELRSWALIPGTEAFTSFPKVYCRARQLIKYRRNTKRMRHWFESLHNS